MVEFYTKSTIFHCVVPLGSKFTFFVVVRVAYLLAHFSCELSGPTTQMALPILTVHVSGAEQEEQHRNAKEEETVVEASFSLTALFHHKYGSEETV